MMPDYQYAIIVPAWNEAEFIESCVASIKLSMSSVPYKGQLIVVDNNSNDNTATLAAASGAQVVFEPVNQISRARNAGALAASASIYVFVDADSHISAALLNAALDAVQHENKVGGGAYIRGDRKLGFTAWLGINGWNWISRTFKLAAGCFVFVRADAFHELGGFTLKQYAGEELVLSRRLRRLGAKRGMAFHIITEHTIETSLRKMDWYSQSQLLRQLCFALLPGAMRSRRFMRTWYDDSTKRTRLESMIKQQAFGTWPSPITAQLVTTAGVRLGDVAHQGDAAFWAEARPDDDGRSTIVKARLGETPVDLTSMPFNPRTRVHEYGGGSWWVDDRYLYFVHWDDQRLYRVDHSDAQNNSPEPISPVPDVAQALRYADGCISADGQWIVCVRESHQSTKTQASNEIVLIRNATLANDVLTDAIEPVQVDSVVSLAEGADFYSTPRFSPDGHHLSWIQWSHPQMPWDGTELMLAEVRSDMTLGHVQKIAGGAAISVMGAMWTQTGALVYASDESGWWNIYQYAPPSQNVKQLTQFTDREVGTPAWIFGTQRFVELVGNTTDAQHAVNKQPGTDFRLALLVTHKARDQLHVLEADGQINIIETPYTSISSIAADKAGRVLVQGQAENQQASITLIDCQPSAAAQAQPLSVRPAEPINIDAAWLSSPQAIQYSSGDHQAHAFFYPPAALNITGLTEELPPLLVMGHGGPTSHTTAGLKLAIQYWTSRGIAVVDVNYGGSSGFGRDYRRLLNGAWGVVDVQDCVAATQYLADNGLVDPARMVIRGGSAGGLTVLRALQTSTSFAGGTSLYGVTDLELLAGDTHKFESRYLDGLLGGPYPEHKATYVERSPIHHSDQLNCPILVLQGDEDKVVPPNQSAAIIAAAAAKGLPHAYVLFTGEQHGFRQTDNIIRALQIELWFYGRVLGFESPDDIEAPPEAVGL